MLGALLLIAVPAAAEAQVFLASRPHPDFAVGPLFVRAAVSPALGPITVEILWGLVVPPTRSALEIEQDLYLLWPDAITGDPGLGAPEPALARFVTERGFDVVGEGRAALFAQALYQLEDGQPPEPLPGGAPFVAFVRSGGPLGLSAPATLLRIPWTPRLANRTWLVSLRLVVPGAAKKQAAGWVQRLFWGPRHRITLSFNDVRHRALFPLYVENRERVVRLADDPSQLLIDFADLPRLRIDEVFPPSSGRRVSDSLELTEVVSLFLDRSEGITPQVLTVQFGYLSGVQAWAPVLVPTLFFVLGNVAAVLIRGVAERLSRRWSGRVALWRKSTGERPRTQGVVLPRHVVAALEPGRTTYADVLRLCGRDGEESEHLAAPDRRTIVYRGRRLVPHHRRLLGWLAAVTHWDVEHHEVEIALDKGVVRDVQARVRRSRLATSGSERVSSAGGVGPGGM